MDLPKLIEQIALNGQAQVLIVGARGANFPASYHQHPQVVIWDTEKGGKVPEAVRLILPLRFLGHALWVALIEEARKRNIVMLGLKGTGEVKRILEPLLQAGRTAQPPEAPIPAASLVKRTDTVAEALATLQTNNTKPTETLRAWMERQTRWDGITEKGAIAREGHRLVELAHREGYPSATYGGITVELGRLRKIRLTGVDPKPKKKRVKQAQAKRRPKVGAPRRAPVSVSQEDIQLLRLVAEGKAALDLVAEAIKERSSKRQELISQLKGL